MEIGIGFKKVGDKSNNTGEQDHLATLNFPELFHVLFVGPLLLSVASFYHLLNYELYGGSQSKQICFSIRW
ncbi:5132_t:CDS:2 [Funneliformis caledonium]|uniref:5132_t:CDS:1 n=1 Tax=Funneliformis caledonium TaxID=1117310 RepID=A0A9N8VF35_9GLOM|nr:5132_t:CDS:2 [Funneliformis caledonium]